MSICTGGNFNSGGERIYRFNCTSGSRCGDNDYYYRHRYFVSSKIDPFSATMNSCEPPVSRK